MPPGIIRLKTSAAGAGQRLDVWLSANLPGLSRSRIQSLIESGNITISGRKIRASRKITANMEIEINIPPARPTELVAEDIPLTILYEDADIIVINKQAGLVVHPAAGHASGTLVNALMHHCDNLAGIGGELRPGIVHRLDKDTSGVMVAAKNEQAMMELARQFKEGLVQKKYVAVVHGTPSPARGRIQTSIGRSRHDRKKMSVTGSTGRVAVTNYEITQSFGFASLMQLCIETGRTHQIRVHMAHIGHPVIGDKQYGGRRKQKLCLPVEAKRQLLHAEFLAFTHPVNGKNMCFKAAIPEDMNAVIKALKRIKRNLQ